MDALLSAVRTGQITPSSFCTMIGMDNTGGDDVCRARVDAQYPNANAQAPNVAIPVPVMNQMNPSDVKGKLQDELRKMSFPVEHIEMLMRNYGDADMSDLLTKITASRLPTVAAVAVQSTASAGRARGGRAPGALAGRAGAAGAPVSRAPRAPVGRAPRAPVGRASGPVAQNNQSAMLPAMLNPAIATTDAFYQQMEPVFAAFGNAIQNTIKKARKKPARKCNSRGSCSRKNESESESNSDSSDYSDYSSDSSGSSDY